MSRNQKGLRERTADIRGRCFKKKGNNLCQDCEVGADLLYSRDSELVRFVVPGQQWKFSVAMGDYVKV